MIIDRGHESVLEHEKISIKFVCDRGCCYDDKTKVLTNHGWKYFEELNKGDEFYSLDENNNLVLVEAKSIIIDDYSGNMDYWESTQVNLMVTPNHNMWVFDHEKRSLNTKKWKFIKSEECINRRYKFIKNFLKR